MTVANEDISPVGIKNTRHSCGEGDTEDNRSYFSLETLGQRDVHAKQPKGRLLN